MPTTTNVYLDEATIRQVGLQPTDKPINAQIAHGARVFKYPHLEDVYIMESDLYGNPMPKDSCFLVFNGKHGLIGKHLNIATLKNATVDEIRKLIEANAEG